MDLTNLTLVVSTDNPVNGKLRKYTFLLLSVCQNVRMDLMNLTLVLSTDNPDDGSDEPDTCREY